MFFWEVHSLILGITLRQTRMIETDYVKTFPLLFHDFPHQMSSWKSCRCNESILRQPKRILPAISSVCVAFDTTTRTPCSSAITVTMHITVPVWIPLSCAYPRDIGSAHGEYRVSSSVSVWSSDYWRNSDLRIAGLSVPSFIFQMRRQSTRLAKNRNNMLFHKLNSSELAEDAMRIDLGQPMKMLLRTLL